MRRKNNQEDTWYGFHKIALTLSLIGDSAGFNSIETDEELSKRFHLSVEDTKKIINDCLKRGLKRYYKKGRRLLYCKNLMGRKTKSMWAYHNL